MGHVAGFDVGEQVFQVIDQLLLGRSQERALRASTGYHSTWMVRTAARCEKRRHGGPGNFLEDLIGLEVGSQDISRFCRVGNQMVHAENASDYSFSQGSTAA